MTDQDAMLKLARAVYPERDWVMLGNDAACVERYTSVIREDGFTFDPATNDSQAVAVLCWLLSCYDIKDPSAKEHFISWEEWKCGRYIPMHEPHDNTPASFRAAVTKAALRVVRG